MCDGCGAREGVSMLDVLNEEDRLDRQARLVLGGTDDAACTYPLGYVKRQPLYACLTCAPTEPGGVCLACCLHCHQGHDLVEMYTKRHFRCDCGNARFDHECRLTPEKTPTNDENRYNHNFRGLYCVCERPYPDPDRSAEEEEEDMLQCAVCEDWYHVSHLDAVAPSEEESCELVCARCVEQHQFLELYVEAPVDRPSNDADEEEGGCTMERRKEKRQFLNHQNVTPVGHGSKEADEEEEKCVCKMERNKEKSNVEKYQFLNHQKVTPVGHGSKEADEEDVCAKRRRKGKEHILKRQDEETPVACDCPSTAGGVSGRCRSVFLPDGWRTSLCRCNTCLARYHHEGVAYLLDPEDTMRWYEERAERGVEASRYDMAMERLAGMDRVARDHAVEGYNELQANLTEYLKKFADNGKMVREEDIKEFFDGLANKKRRRLE